LDLWFITLILLPSSLKYSYDTVFSICFSLFSLQFLPFLLLSAFLVWLWIRLSQWIGKQEKTIEQLWLNYLNLGLSILYFFIVFICLQVLFELLAKGGTVKGLIEKKDLVQVSCKINHYCSSYCVLCFWQNSTRVNINALILKHKVASLGVQIQI